MKTSNCLLQEFIQHDNDFWCCHSPQNGSHHMKRHVKLDQKIRKFPETRKFPFLCTILFEVTYNF